MFILLFSFELMFKLSGTTTTVSHFFPFILSWSYQLTEELES